MTVTLRRQADAQNWFGLESLERRLLLDGGPLVDLSVSFAKVSLPPAVVDLAAVKGSVRLSIGNEGDVAMPVAQRVDVSVVARPRGGGADVVLAARQGQWIGGLRAGRQRSVTLAINLPGGLAAEEYDLVAAIAPSTALPAPDADPGNDTAVAAEGLVAAAPFVDLLADVAAVRVRGPVLAGDSGWATVSLRNMGNVNLSGGVRWSLEASGDQAVGGDEPLAEIESPSLNLRPGASRSFRIHFTLPTALATGGYYLLARVAAVDPGLEDNARTANNQAFADEAIDVQALLSLGQWFNYFEAGTWTYEATAGGAVAPMVVTAAAEDVGGLSGARVTGVWDGGAGTSQEVWFVDPAVAEYVSQWHVEGDVGGVDEGEFTLNMKGDGLQVSPLAMQRGQTYRSQTAIDGTWSATVNGSALTADITDGTASVSSQLLDYEMVQMPDSSTAAAAKISVTSIYSGLMSVSYMGRTFSGSMRIRETNVFWAVPEVGVVAARQTALLTASLEGAAGVSRAATARLQLVDYSGS